MQSISQHDCKYVISVARFLLPIETSTSSCLETWSYDISETICGGHFLDLQHDELETSWRRSLLKTWLGASVPRIIWPSTFRLSNWHRLLYGCRDGIAYGRMLM